MPRRTKGVLPATSRFCEVCGTVLGSESTCPDQFCRSFLLFRSALFERFCIALEPLPGAARVSLEHRFRGCRTIEALTAYLNWLSTDVCNVRDSELAMEWIRALLTACERFQLATEYASISDLREAIEPRIRALSGVRLTTVLGQIAAAQDPTKLITILREELVERIKPSLHPQDANEAQILMAEAVRFSAAHHSRPVPPSSAHAAPPAARVA